MDRYFDLPRRLHFPCVIPLLRNAIIVFRRSIARGTTPVVLAVQEIDRNLTKGLWEGKATRQLLHPIRQPRFPTILTASAS
jgi:hypothetical protein